MRRAPLLVPLLVATAWHAAVPGVARAQVAERETSPYLTANVVSGAAMGGIGAMLNRNPGQPWPRAFVRGAAAGAVGGWLQYQGKRQVTNIAARDRLEYAWLARGLHAAGSSIIENAAANRAPLQSFRFNLGFVRLDIEPRTRSIHPRLLPAALIGTLQIARWGHLDARRSLRTGVLTFRAFQATDRVRGLAVTRVNAVLYAPGMWSRQLNETLAHEVVHTLQYDDFSGATPFAKPLAARAEDWWLARNVGHWIYPDLHAGIDAFRYEILNGGTPTCDNALEREAYTFADFVIGRCP